MGQFEISGLYGYLLFITIYLLYQVVYIDQERVMLNLFADLPRVETVEVV